VRISPAPAFLVVTAFLMATRVPAVAQSTDLGSYVLLAEDELHANGLLVAGGDVGVNHGFLSSAGRPLTAAHSTLAASSVRLDTASTCNALFANDVQKSGPACSNAHPLATPILDLRSACAFPDPFPHCGGAAVVVSKGGQETLPSGPYGLVRVMNGATLILSGGNYAFCSLHIARRARVLALKPTRLSIEGDLVVGNSTRLAPGSTAAPCDLEIFTAGAKVGIQRSADVQARLCAPNAALHIDHRASVIGRFAARTINVGRVTARAATSLECPAQVTTTTTTTTTTTNPSLCGNGQIDPGEQCDPAGTLTCPDSVGGAFLACEADCTCPFGPPVTTTTVVTTTTTTTTTPAVCGNSQVEAGEECDPPGSIVCPDSTGGAFVACEADCSCPFGPPVTTSTTVATTTTTTTTPAVCGNGQIESGEQCDPPGTLSCPGSVGGAFLACNANCTCPGGPTTTTTSPGSTSTSTSLTSTTVSPGSSTSTTIQVAEICGNCVDDDHNNLTDFEDPACCSTPRFAMILRRGRIHPKGQRSRLRLGAGLASNSLPFALMKDDVFLQIRPAQGTDILCAKVPAKEFMRMHGAFKFWDSKHTVESAQGLDDMTITVRSGSVRFRTLGKRVRFKAPPAGNLQVTVAFHNSAGEVADRCSTTTAPFRTGRRKALLSP
jgi:hypothetical protein